MFERRSLKYPIMLGVLMIIAIVALTVGWILLTTGIKSSRAYIVLLTLGSITFFLVLTGVVMYLVLSIKAINLTRRQSNFIDSVTHELKSPIASLKLYLQTLTLRDVSEAEREKFLKFMAEDINRLDGLINHLLDARATEKNNRDKLYESIRLDELIDDCVQTVCNRYRVPTESVDCQLKSIEIFAERVDAMMIFRNLIDNAVKYAGDPPQVNVSMRTEGTMVVVEISDNGEGIPHSMRRKVFGRFVRVGEELQRKKPGTGLGLYIVSTLTRRLGGKVRIVDRDKRWGTVFEVRLPFQVDSVSSIDPSAADSLVPGGH
ncbi:MAG: HAMP domain-containing sensor histidine kinase [Planctomycetota bacterium]